MTTIRKPGLSISGLILRAGRQCLTRTSFVLLCTLFISVVGTHAQVSVTTNHYDNSRTGQNTQETILTPQNVSNGTQFGVNFTQPVDGNIYGQPLYVPNVAIPGNGTHNVIFVVTAGDSVYAFDADSNAGSNANPLWHASLIDTAHGAAAGATSVPSGDVNCGDLTPQIGITSTPVIDLSTGTMYVEAKSKESLSYVHRLHALDITTGAEKFGGPATITALVAGTGDGSSGGILAFNPLRQQNRPGLLLVNGVIYIGFASHCDNKPYHGWLFAYDAATLAQKAVYVTTPNGTEAGIWMSGNGPAADAGGNLYLTTGNGTFDNSTQLSDSVLKFVLSGSTLSVTDWFTPHNQSYLNSNDDDLGAGGVLVLPDQPGAHPHLLLVGPGKDSSGPIYLIDRDNMTDGTGTHWCGPLCTFDSQIVEEIQNAIQGKMWSTPSYWNNNLYFWATNDRMRAYSLSNGLLNTAPFAASPETYNFPGSNLSISANGATNGIVWSVEPPITLQPSTQAATLKAHDANSLAVLYSSDQNLAICPADLAAAIKFSVPTVANGQVFLGTDSELQVYGFSTQGSSSCGYLGFTGQFSCSTDGNAGPCDTGTITVTVGSTTETFRYDGLGFFTGTGYNNGNPGIPQTLAQTVANLFNNDPNSQVTATYFSDSYANGFDVQFKSKASGGDVNYGTSITVVSDYGNFQQFGTLPNPIEWTWSPLIVTGGVDPTQMTEVSPLTGRLQGGRGAAAGANATVAPSSLTFAAQTVGTTSGAQSVTLSISATATNQLFISSITASGDFTQTNNCGAALPVGTSCTVNVSFRPTATGTRTGTLSITDNASGSPQTVSLTGTGVAPVVSLSPTSLTFASQNTGTTSAAQTVTLSNTGTASLSITSITVSGDYAQTNTCGSSVAVGGNCTISVTFSPTATGTRTGTVSINDNASGSPQTVSLTGTGVAPVVSLSPTSLTFASQNTGTTSAAQTVTLTNTGTASLSITSLAISGDYAQTNTCGSSLAAGANCTISVTFSPTAGGTRTGTVSITDNASGSPQTVSLTGTGVAVPTVSLSPTSLTFGNQATGTTSAAQSVTLRNIGAAGLSITSITVSGDYAQTNTCGSSVAAGASCTISVTFTPTATGTRTGTVSVNDNAGGSPQTVSLTGTGVAPVVSLSPTSLTFGNQATGTTSAAQTVTLTNTGTASLSITSITISGDFAQTNTCGSSVAAGANCTISVTFTPTATGTRTGTVSISDNASGSPHTLNLTGTAVLPPAPGTGTVSLNGTLQCFWNGESNFCDWGTIGITVNGFTDSLGYPNGDIGFLAQYLTNQINTDNPYVTATWNNNYSFPVITLTARTAGSNTNYSLSAFTSTSDPTDFPSGSYTLTPSGPTLTGGHN